MNPRSATFEAEHVTVRFGDVVALRDVSFSIASGEAVAFVGPSGSGKTTLLRLLNGARRPDEGSVAVDGRQLTELSNGELRRVRADIGFVHQDLCLVPNLRVVQNVLAGRLGRWAFLRSLRAMTFPRTDDVRRAFEILERVGIPDKLYERTDTLSGGQRQRVAIARALFQDPEALLADEPVSSVDPARARDTVALLTDISRERGLTLCMSIHNLDLARAYFPRIIGLRAGRVAFDAPTDDIDDGTFRELYHLSAEEMLVDGA
jgi:phosphonate transport system ATP-binding protein